MLSVQLSANTAKFSGGMQRAEKTLRSFRRSAARSVKMAAGFGIALGGVAVGALVVATKRQFELIDSTAKMADKLGMATESLIQLRHAAKLTGVEAKTLDMALQRITRRTSEAAQGTGEAKDTLKEMGLNAQVL